MPAEKRIDLRGVISPLDLLRCKNSLKSMEEGDLLDVILADLDVVEDLEIIVNRSNDEIVYKKRTAGCFRIGIKKGPAQ